MKSACGQRASMQEHQTTDDPHPGRQTRLLARTGGLEISLSGYRVARTDTCYTLTRIGHASAVEEVAGWPSDWMRRLMGVEAAALTMGVG